jgi:hypothetical protein
VDRISKYVAVWQSRVAFGVAFFGALLVGLWPDHPRNIDPAKLVACILTGSAWIASELASAVPKVSEHDRGLFRRITEILNDDALTFLMQHDFAINFNTAYTAPVIEISEWHGPQYQFNDSAIQKRWVKLWSRILSLSNLYGSNLVSTDNIHVLTAWHIGFDRHSQPPQAHKEIKDLNDGAHAVYIEFDKFVRYTRRRLAL